MTPTQSTIQLRNSRGTYFSPDRYDCVYVANHFEHPPVRQSELMIAMRLFDTLRDLMLAGF